MPSRSSGLGLRLLWRPLGFSLNKCVFYMDIKFPWKFHQNLFTLTIYFIGLNASIWFVLIYRPHPVLYRHDKPNEPTKKGPLSFVLFESPFTSVSTVSRGHHSLVSLYDFHSGRITSGSPLKKTVIDSWLLFFCRSWSSLLFYFLENFVIVDTYI